VENTRQSLLCPQEAIPLNLLSKTEIYVRQKISKLFILIDKKGYASSEWHEKH